jgi:hypothetical protein
VVSVQQWINVQVTIDEETFNDAVWATNEKEALIVGYWNWEAASLVEIIEN